MEFYGIGLSNLPLPDRATIANMSPEYGATVGFFPLDQQTLAYLLGTGRDPATVDMIEQYQVLGTPRSSQAGFVIPIAASECADVRFAILLSGPTVTVAQHNYYDQQADDPALSTFDLSGLLEDFKSPEGDFDPKKFIREMNFLGVGRGRLHCRCRRHFRLFFHLQD